jgi:predicted ribosome quality control (RQC) complex YloA/Tae2 family protein
MHSSGLSATELSEVLAELGPVLRQATVRDIARLDGKDDLLFFLDTPDGHRALHIVTGGRRARITLTKRRFHKREFLTGPLVDRLRQRLLGCAFEGVSQPQGEKSCGLTLIDPEGNHLALQIELFGARGLWCLVDEHGDILELSRLPNVTGREIRPGARYVAPPPREGAAEDPPSRFAQPVAAAVDAWFTDFDREQEVTRLRKNLTGVIDRAARKLQHKIDGLARQRKEIHRIPEIRQQADMLLAYGFSQATGATSLTVPDPNDPDHTLTYPLDPSQSIQAQADKLYKRARKLTDGAEIAVERQAKAEAALEPVIRCREEFDACDDLDSLLGLQDRLATLGLIQATRSAKTTGPVKDRKLQKATKGYNFRRFTSSEGYLILVGRTNRENDRLSVAVARGNDLWFHVGQGYAGSHVVIRLPRGKTASLESLLDAGTLAHYFSKARNAPRCEVIYTQAKNVRKPKGVPPGSVTTTGTKTVLVAREEDRLRRLLDSADGGHGP